MDTCISDAKATLERDRSALLWIRNKAAQLPQLNELHLSAQESARKFSATVGMSTHLTWSVIHGATTEHMLNLHVGGIIQLKDTAIDNMSYDLCVVNADGNRVLRRYHFDYANNKVRSSRRSSVFHLQYGGKLPPAMAAGFDCDHLDGWLEEPRLFYTPMSLSLILHMAFREFRDAETDKLCEDGDWQGKHVRPAQDALLVPFFENSLAKVKDERALLWDAACLPSSDAQPDT